MCELVGKSENLRRFGVGAVDEHDRRVVINERKPAKLFGVKAAVRVRADNPVDHDEHSSAFGVLDQAAQRLGPVAEVDPAGETRGVPGADRRRGLSCGAAR
jgi:hypothetical protein